MDEGNDRLTRVVRASVGGHGGDATTRQDGSDPRQVQLAPPDRSGTDDEVLWEVVLNRSQARTFKRYKRYIDSVFGCDVQSPTPGESTEQTRPTTFEQSSLPRQQLPAARSISFHGKGAYEALKSATEAFMEYECGVWLDVLRGVEVDSDATQRDAIGGTRDLRNQFLAAFPPLPGTLPYLSVIRERLADLAVKDDLQLLANSTRTCSGPLLSRLVNPCLMELIWNYWHEESMQTQTLKAIAMQFQNRDLPRGYASIRTLQFDALRPMSNLLWGWVQDEYNRLSVSRRSHEYAHQYGLTLLGGATAGTRPAETRSRFLGAFHDLLNRCTVYYDQRDDMTRRADAFPVLNALRELHMILAEGAHNQFGDLTPTARGEALIEQWLLARPEMREFFGQRVMVPYPEDWMDRVDAMKSLQGWSDTSVTQYNRLAVFGEQILLGVRYGAWMSVVNPASAANWADFWRAQVQGYVHAYHAVTGVNLASREVRAQPIDTTVPALHIARRVAEQRRGALGRR